MKRIVRFLFLTSAATFFSACGVKGKPSPPLEPPFIGRGEPVFSEATQDIQLKKKATPKIQGDWDEPKDFPSDTEDKPERSR